ncbi:MAG TPA: hypothetical protein VEF33_05215 [Syntrophales bacterium]|nr:hypothetical protein [Syntrophales bacterium]
MKKKKEKKVVTGHVKVKRRYGDRFFRERISQAVKSILADLHPDADEIDVKFYPDGLPSVLSSQINYIFTIRGSMPQMTV